MNKKKTIRNVVIFAIVTAGCGFVGNALNALYQPPNPMESLGVLVWLVSPLAANLLLRWLGKDGWKTFGLNPRLFSGWQAYLAAILIVPLISLVTLGLSLLFGTIRASGVSGAGLNSFITLLGVGLAGSVVKNIFEEFAWRGYLTERLDHLKANPFLNALVTGLIWASWHIPYYLYFLDPATIQSQTTLSVPALIAFSFILLPMQAFAYNELRLLSKSVWPAWLLHTLSNAFGLALITGGMFTISRGLPATLLTPGTEGIVYAVLMGLAGWGLYQKRKSKTL